MDVNHYVIRIYIFLSMYRQVKVDKHTGKSCFDGPFSSPRIPIYGRKGVDSLVRFMQLFSLDGLITSCFGEHQSFQNLDDFFSFLFV